MAVACGARLSCSVFMVYSVHAFGGKPTYIESGARSHMAVCIV